MKPRPSSNTDLQGDLFKVELETIINPDHELARLAGQIDWTFFERELGEHFCEHNGAPAKPVRLMVGLHFIKHTFNLSDEQTVLRWVENPYWQHFCGEKFFEHTLPIDSSSMTRWRKLIGEKGAEGLLAESIATGLKTGALKPASLDKVNVDTTVQEKAVTFPTDARLYYKMREKLVRLAEHSQIKLRQSYRRVARKALIMVGRYGRVRRKKLLLRETRRLKGYLRKVTTDVMRKIGDNQGLQTIFFNTLLDAVRLLEQKNIPGCRKLYSVHAPEVECIDKGKAHKKYEFGCKVSLVATSKEGFVIGAQALHGNPYDGHTLSGALRQAGELSGGELKGDVFVDLGYRKHDYEGAATVNIVGRDLKGIPKALGRWMKRRAAIEPTIGHMKNDGRLGRNFLLGKLGDKLNALLCACGHNLRLMLRRMRLERRRGLVFVFLCWLWCRLVGLAGRSKDSARCPRREILIAAS
ncbi:MAG: IS5 family transposase [Aquabacterium sp.]|uniref:IS5 family transposase n=1 Tax=Aquabacterium sp. TaxID=1872578 RepID=UPI002720EBD1|nr:IS5 family transposase [Aquabacterium sp.]MDO9006376.1 IS5 family transposase [Aquabacterium sp.]